MIRINGGRGGGSVGAFPLADAENNAEKQSQYLNANLTFELCKRLKYFL